MQIPARRLKRIATLALGLGGLVWALASLQAVFLDERDAGRASIAARTRALEAYAKRALAERLRTELDAQRERIEAAARDPLLPSQHLLLVRRGEQISPRSAAARPGEATPARALYRALLADSAPSTGEADGPFAERVALFGALRRAVAGGERAAVESAFRAILAHRARYRIAAEYDIPYVLALVDDFAQTSRPDRRLLEILIREGVPEVEDGLQRALLRARDRFTAPDFEFLRERVLALSESGAVRRDDFLARTREEGVSVELDPTQTVAYVSADGAWYVEPRDERSMGVRIDLAEEIHAIATSMRAAGLLAPDDAIALRHASDADPTDAIVDDLASPHAAAPARVPWPETRAVAIDALAIALASPRATAETAALARVYWLKTGLSLAGGALAIALVALLLLLERRERRWVELRADFVSAVSHELRTPLASIRLQAETLGRRLAGSELGRDYPARIIRDVDGLSFLVENVLSFNRIGRDGWAPRKSRVSLGDVVHDVCEEARQGGAHKVEYRTEGLDGLELEADPELLRLLFANLVRNALQYNEREPVEIDITALVHAEIAEIHVADNGIGIPRDPPEVWETVFEDFHREARERARGSGLGLAICRRVAHAHGGSIRIARSDSSGTTFRLRLPLGNP